MSGLRDNMQSEQMGLIKLNDTSVKNMASNLTKLKQVNTRVGSCQFPLQATLQGNV